VPEMIVGARNRVDVPAPAVAVGGLLAAARVVDVTDPHDLMGAEYESDACAEPHVWERWCIPSNVDCTPAPEQLKEFDQEMLLVEGDPFALYAGIDCDLAPSATMSARARKRFDYTERAGVDTIVYGRLEALAGADVANLGGPFPLPQAIGIAEAYAASVYGGVPTLVVPVELVPCACDNGVVTYGMDGRLVTCQGSLVANVVTGGTLTPPPASATVYVTGQITLLRGPVMTLNAPPGYDCNGDPTPPRALAERLYVPLIECLVGKVEVTCS
jgi:hypothetical protein